MREDRGADVQTGEATAVRWVMEEGSGEGADKTCMVGETGPQRARDGTAARAARRAGQNRKLFFGASFAGFFQNSRRVWRGRRGTPCFPRASRHTPDAGGRRCMPGWEEQNLQSVRRHSRQR